LATAAALATPLRVCAGFARAAVSPTILGVVPLRSYPDVGQYVASAAATMSSNRIRKMVTVLGTQRRPQTFPFT
jgi:hypothetical protein